MVSGLVFAALLSGFLGLLDPLGHYLGITFTLLIFGLPSLYLIVRKPLNAKKGVIAGLLFGVLFGFPFDFVATYAGAWVINEKYILFPRLILGVVHLDELVWFFFWVLFAVVFYEYFVENDRGWRISRHVGPAVAFGAFSTLAVIILFLVHPEVLKPQYAYLLLGSAALLPFLFTIVRRPRLLIKFAAITPFFFLVYLGFDLLALYKGWWIFSGNYIGGISAFGLFLPLEELVIWIFLGSCILTSYHELFIDDGK